MINKKNLWFLTLFSLILVLSVYYITMPSELLLNTHANYETNEPNNDETSSINESAILVALRVEKEEQRLNELDSLKLLLTNTETSIDEKNNAFEKIKLLNLTRGEEEELEKKINEEFSVKSFVKIDGDQVRVVINQEDHNTELANNIMRTVQSRYQTKMYISVKFQA